MKIPSSLPHCIAAMVAALALCAIAPARAADPSIPACLAGSPVPMMVRIGEPVPRRALLRGGISPALEIVDAQTTQVLWSASRWLPASQQFDAMHAQFAGSLLPIDLDGDGIHDRIYAGDLSGRLWRFDLRHGNPAEQWAAGGVFADLSAGALRGFIAPPDVSLAADEPAQSAWFNIVLGTARLGPATVANRLYVLRDRFPFEAWTQDRYERWRPLRESDLVQLPRLGVALAQPAPDGYFIETGAADMLSAAITVSGRATLALSDSSSAMGAGCLIAAVVASIDLATAAEARSASADGGGSSRLALSMKAGDSFSLLRTGSHAACSLAAVHVASCDVDLSPRRTWWRREDAD
jgi:hypothetical protein